MTGDLKLSATGWIAAGIFTFAAFALIGLLARAVRK